MNQAQKTILFLGLVAIVVFCLRPPYHWEDTTYILSRDSRAPHRAGVQVENIGHHWIWSSPQGWDVNVSQRERMSRTAQIDWQRLGIYVGLTALVTPFVAFVVLGNRKRGANG